MNFHPALQIMMWCLLVAIMQRLEWLPLILATGAMMVFAWLLAAKKLLQLVRRTRWIMLSLLVIYAFSTPGQPLIEALGEWSPVREGLTDGAAQLLRLLAALASLAILLGRLHRLELIAGLYSLFAPLGLLGLSRERCAIRLALTLHYAEVAMLRSHAHWQDALMGLFEPHTEVVQAIELPTHPMSLKDVLVSILLGVIVLGLVLR